MKDNITIETAKLAKQAGFDWECKYYYRSDEQLIYDHDGNVENWNDEIYSMNGYVYSAPTQSVLQRWLREVKSIWVSVTCDSPGDLQHAMYRAELYDEKIGYYYTSYWDDDEKEEFAEEYPTYETALEDGLKQCLTLLIEKQ